MNGKVSGYPETPTLDRIMDVNHDTLTVYPPDLPDGDLQLGFAEADACERFANEQLRRDLAQFVQWVEVREDEYGMRENFMDFRNAQPLNVALMQAIHWSAIRRILGTELVHREKKNEDD